MISGFNLTRVEMREETRSDGRQPLSAISATRDVNDSPVRGIWFQCCLLVSRIMFFPQLLTRYKRIEVIIKIKANFYKEIAQFTILVAIIGNKISKYYFLTCLSQIPYISTRQTYMGKFNSRDSAWYDLFSFSDTSSSQIITKTVARTIETSWQYTCLILDFQKSPSSDFIWRGPRGRLVASLVWSGKLTSGQVKCSHRSDER